MNKAQQLNLNWKKDYTPPESAVSTTLRAWLLHAGSFMQRLREKGIADTKIHVTEQAWKTAEPWEYAVLNLSPEEEVLIREVVIATPEKCWMFARSIFPKHTLTGTESALADLKDKALGTVLFTHPEMQRSPFAYTCLNKDTSWHDKVMEHIQPFISQSDEAYDSLWSRYSVFQLHHKSLLLTEVFLPDIAII